MTIRNSLRLARYVADAARLLREIGPHKVDQADQERGIDISYAVDTNVVLLYLGPDIMGPRSDRGFEGDAEDKGHGGYGEVFHDEPSMCGSALGAVLSRYIFYYLTDRDTPLILLPGHDAEVRAIYRAVVEQASEYLGHVESQRRKLRTIIKAIAGIGSLDKKIEILKSKTPELLSYLYFTHNAGVELSRFNQLIVDCRLLRLILALGLWSENDGEDGGVSHDAIQACSVPLTLEDQILESALRIDWERRLKAEKPKRNRRRLMPDCAALARLELINLRLRHGRVARRLVLITGDEAMFSAGAEYVPLRGDRRTFSELYLRHPRAFLATPMIVLSGRIDDGTDQMGRADFVSGWLETLLARYTDDSGVNSARVRELVEVSAELEELADDLSGRDIDEDSNEDFFDTSGASKNARTLVERASRVVGVDREAPAKIRKEWEKHVDQLSMEHAGASAISRTAVEKTLHTALEQADSDALDELDRLLAERIDRTWREFNWALVVAGLELLLDDEPDGEGGNSPARVRNPPPVIIESCGWADDFVRRMSGTDDISSMVKGERKGLRSLVENDHAGYVQSLVFALVFANAEKWHVADLMARRAISIAERSHGAGSGDTIKLVPAPASGREAFYLCSFVTRIRARTESEASEAKSLLERAEEALRQEPAGDRNVPAVEARFRAERLALELQRHVLVRFAGESMQTRAWREPRSLNGVFEDLVELRRDLDGVTDAWVREHVRRKVVTNTFMAAALMEPEGRLPDDVDDFVFRQCARMVSETISRGDADTVRIPQTRLACAVADYATARFGRPGGDARSAIDNRVRELEQDIRERGKTVRLAGHERAMCELLIRRTRSALLS